MQVVISRRAGLLNLNNNDDKSILYCVAPSFICNKIRSAIEKYDPDQYADFVTLITVESWKSISKQTINLSIGLTDITELEQINRSRCKLAPFRINVFREDIISNKVYLIRSSPFNNGKIINMLLGEFEIDKKDTLIMC